MNGFVKSIVFWRVACFKVGVKSVIALFNSFVATLNGVEFSTFTDSQKFVAIGAAAVAMLSVIDAFLSETIADLKRKKELETGFVKSDVVNP